VEHNEGDRFEGFSEAEERAEEAGAEDFEGTPLGEEGRSEDSRNRGVTHTRMRGELRFFNEVTQRGLIRTSEEDFAVLGSGFVEGQIPVGRCAGVAVDFEVEGVDSESLAVRVSIVDVTPGRRAGTRAAREGLAEHRRSRRAALLAPRPRPQSRR
jgi:hypothetical protein